MFGNNSVSQRYSNKVKIGNWNEDSIIERIKIQEFLDKKVSGTLMVTAMQTKLSHSLQPIKLSKSDDGNLKYGDSILLYSVNTTGVLSVDTSEKVPGHNEAYYATTSTLVKGAVARNVFIIEAYEKDVQVGDKLLYGQKIRLRLNSVLHPVPLYLMSQPVTPLASSKITRKCEVVLTTEKNYDSCFTCLFKDIAYRLECEGTPVPANSELVIQHCNTRQDLNSAAVQHNDYGAEYEVCGHTVLTLDKIHVLHSEFKGNITPEVSLRSEQSKNHWAFLNGDDNNEESK